MPQRRWANTAKPEVIQGMAQTADVLARLGINTPMRLAHFMAQISAETGNGKHMVESLIYSAERMTRLAKAISDRAVRATFRPQRKSAG